MQQNHAISGLILAAGEGSRLRPATLTCPKALMPFCGVPLLELAVDRLAALPLRRLAINACYLGEQIDAAVTTLGGNYQLPLAVSREERLLGTGGGIRRALPLLGDADHILIHNADVVLDYDIQALLDAHLTRQPLATVLLVPGRGPCTVTMDAEGRITTLKAERGMGDYTFGCVYVITRALLDYLTPDDPACIANAMQQAIADGKAIRGLSVGEAFWADFGTLASYLGAQRAVQHAPLRHSPRLQAALAEQAQRRAALIAQGVRCSGAVALGEHLSLPANTHLHDVVALDGATLAQPLLCGMAILGIDRVTAPPPVDASRLPHPTVYATLGVDQAACTLEPLRKQASGRLYYRLRAGKKSWVWSAYAHDREENAVYATVADFLDRLGLRVPQVICHRPELGENVCTDLGGTDLLSLAGDAAVEDYLRQALAQIARLHVLGGQQADAEALPMRPPYTEAFYRDVECAPFRTHLLGTLLKHPEWWDPVEGEYSRLLQRLMAMPQAPIHRDLQSANILITKGQVGLIDFQGIRPGCPAYDVAALLYDPYMAHPAVTRRRGWQAYRQAVAALGGAALPDDLLPLAAVQRLLQALGCYGNLWANQQNAWFGNAIAPALGLLREAAEEAALPAFATLAERCRQACQPLLPC